MKVLYRLKIQKATCDVRYYDSYENVTEGIFNWTHWPWHTVRKVSPQYLIIPIPPWYRHRWSRLQFYHISINWLRNLLGLRPIIPFGYNIICQVHKLVSSFDKNPKRRPTGKNLWSKLVSLGKWIISDVLIKQLPCTALNCREDVSVAFACTAYFVRWLSWSETKNWWSKDITNRWL